MRHDRDEAVVIGQRHRRAERGVHAGQRVGRAALHLALLGDEQEKRRVGGSERHELLATRHLDRLLAAHGA